MKNKYVKYGVLAVVVVVIAFSALLFGTHIGKTVTADEMKLINNELSYDIDDLEGTWVKYSYDPLNKRNSVKLIDFRKTGDTTFDQYIASFDKKRGVSEEDWSLDRTLTDVFYNKQTRTMKYVSEDTRYRELYRSKPKQLSMAVGEDFNFMSFVNTDDDNEYKFETIYVRLKEEDLNMKLDDIDTYFENATGLKHPEMYEKADY